MRPTLRMEVTATYRNNSKSGKYLPKQKYMYETRWWCGYPIENMISIPTLLGSNLQFNTPFPKDSIHTRLFFAMPVI